jgi:hypothetical protein
MDLATYMNIKHRLNRGERDIASKNEMKEIFSILDTYRDLTRRIRLMILAGDEIALRLDALPDLNELQKRIE